MDLDRGAGNAGGFSQERRFSLVGFDQIERQVGSDGQNQAGESGTGAEIDSPVGPGRQERYKLERVLDMTFPEHGLIVPCNQIDGPVPLSQEGGEALEAVLRFT